MIMHVTIRKLLFFFEENDGVKKEGSEHIFKLLQIPLYCDLGTFVCQQYCGL